LTSFRPHLLPLSAHTPEALARFARDVLGLLRDEARPPRLQDLCWTAGARRRHRPYRAFVTGRSRSEMVEGFARVSDADPSSFLRVEPQAGPPRIALVLPEEDAGPGGSGFELLWSELAFVEAVAPMPGEDLRALQAGVESVCRHWGVEARVGEGEPSVQLGGDDVPNALMEAIGELYVRGFEPCWRNLSPAGARVISLPLPAWQRGGSAPAESAAPAPDPAAEGWLRNRLAEPLGLTPDEVDLETEMGEIGLDSVVAVDLTMEFQERYGVEIDLSELAELTGLQVAERLDAASPAEHETARLEPDRGARHEPFPLTEIQRAYYVGRSERWELGGLACQLYREFESDSLDVPRVEHALGRVVERHDMLRAVIESPRTQRVLEAPGAVRIPVSDLSEAGDEEVRDALDTMRSELSHRVSDPGAWPLFEIRAIRLPDGRCRVGLRQDLLVADGRSWLMAGGEVDALHDDPEASLDETDLTFRDYVLAQPRLEESERFERAREYWTERAADLPGPPPLPFATQPDALGAPRFRRIEHRIPAAGWRELTRRARANGATPSTALCFAYAAALGAWSKASHFTLNVTTSDRPPLHPDLPRVVGDFTSLTLLEVELDERDVASGVKRLRERLWRDLEHRTFSGTRVMRERARLGIADQGMPVVFTSLLGAAPPGPPPLSCLGEQVYAVSQTPQVWLDHQIVEDGGDVRLSWDAVDGLFDGDELEAAFAAYTDLVESMAESDEAWQREAVALVEPVAS
jgi:acyl carrier protein